MILSRSNWCFLAIAAILTSASIAFSQAVVSVDTLTAGGEVLYPTSLLTGQVAAMMTTPLSNLPTNFNSPDTRLQFRNPATIVDNDDAGSDGIGAGSVSPVRGSAVRYLATGTTVTADFRAYGFDAAQAGPFVATRATFSPTGGPYNFFDMEPNDTGATAQPLVVPAGTAQLGFGNLTAGDLDLYALTLGAGDIVSAMTIPLSNLATLTNFGVPDTRLDMRAADGTTIIVTNDDGGLDAVGAASVSVRGSVIRYQATSASTFNLTVRGFGGTDVGDYALLVSVVPEPAALCIVAGLGALTLVHRRRRGTA